MGYTEETELVGNYLEVALLCQIANKHQEMRKKWESSSAASLGASIGKQIRQVQRAVSRKLGCDHDPRCSDGMSMKCYFVSEDGDGEYELIAKITDDENDTRIILQTKKLKKCYSKLKAAEPK